MLKAQVGNRDSIGAVEFRLKCLEADQEGIMVDDVSNIRSTVTA